MEGSLLPQASAPGACTHSWGTDIKGYFFFLYLCHEVGTSEVREGGGGRAHLAGTGTAEQNA